MKQVLSIEQMKHLKELGLDTSDASMVLIATDDDGCKLVGNMYIKVSELNFFSENIDWEQRRYELAKDIIKVVIANENGINSEAVAKYSLNCADALIKRLKEENHG